MKVRLKILNSGLILKTFSNAFTIFVGSLANQKGLTFHVNHLLDFIGAQWLAGWTSVRATQV